MESYMELECPRNGDYIPLHGL
jgi:hypothetical protein